LVSICFDVTKGTDMNVRGAGGIPPQLSACANGGNQAFFSSPSWAWE